MRSFLTAIILAFAVFLAFVFSQIFGSPDPNTIQFTIAPIEIVSYGGQGSGENRISTLLPTNCDTDLVIVALNKFDIPAIRTTTHADKWCIDVKGEHPFKRMTINGTSVTIVKNPESNVRDNTLQNLATEIAHAH
jgi:hypothetical protein